MEESETEEETQAETQAQLTSASSKSRGDRKTQQQFDANEVDICYF